MYIIPTVTVVMIMTECRLLYGIFVYINRFCYRFQTLNRHWFNTMCILNDLLSLALRLLNLYSDPIIIMMSESSTNIYRNSNTTSQISPQIVLDDDDGGRRSTGPYSSTVNEGNLLNDHDTPHSLPLATSICARSYDMGDVQHKLDALKQWSVTTYRCTKQSVFEQLGKTQRTVDHQLEQQIEDIRDLHRQYVNVLQLARGFMSSFHQMNEIQKNLADSMHQLGLCDPKLRVEFNQNSESMRTIAKNAANLENMLKSFISSLQTLCDKTIDDTMLTIKVFEQARLEYDAYRNELAALQQQGDVRARLESAEHQCQQHKTKYDQLRSDVQVKLNFLDENRVKVMKKQLLLLHNAMCAYFSGNATALEATLAQFHISPSAPPQPSFLET